ncbi:hypothetical protein ACIRSS_50155 [Amycolatopsis sp. NPDC101161]|uniref:hypothetical protein n=1 Tax=Amycolatopsis sp. NPDC101161 TaxID=3363940 RepID=UPI003811A83B
MTTRLFFSPDAAAPSWQNVPTAPGSTEQSRNRTEEHQMVDTTAPVREVATVAYTPAALNRLISREIAGRLREVAAMHQEISAAMVAGDGVTPDERRRGIWHRAEADRLEQLAAAELAGVTDGAGR